MAARPSTPPSPQARRQAQLQAFEAALIAQDSGLMQRLLGQWVHRHGVSSLAALGVELAAAEPEGWAWWQGQNAEPEPAAEPVAPVQPPLRRLEPQLPRATRPAPAPSHPALVRLRSWLPDQEGRRAA